MRLAITAMLLAAGLLDAAEKMYLLVISDGKDTRFELPVSGRRGGATGRSHIPDAKGPATYLAVDTRPTESEGVVAGALSLVSTPSFEDNSKTPLAEFTVALGERLVIEDGKAYGLPPLTLTLLEEPRDCGYGTGDVRTFAPSLVVESAYRSGGVCRVGLRNTSAKGVIAVSLGTPEGGHMGHSFFSETPESRPLIKPGATYKMQSGLEFPAVMVAVFEDETFEGDAGLARGLIEEKHGGAAFARRAAATIRELVAATKTDEELAAAVKAYAERLPEAPRESTNSYRQGWNMVQQNVTLHARQIAQMHRVIWTEIAARLDLIAESSDIAR